MLKRRGVPHEVLNAKHHAKEAEIVAQAGQAGSVTIATNMAGRGTDIKLGPGVTDVGGLYVLGTERHEARRVDNQLRGRSGRQGDPGTSQFVISLEDDLLRIFGGERIHRLMDRLGLEEDIPIEHSLISRSVESAQKKVEEQNFQIRKRVLEYDDVMNKQREVIYGQRQRILSGEDLREDVLGIVERILRDEVAVFTGTSRFSEEWELEEMMAVLRNFFPTTLEAGSFGDPAMLDAEEVADRVVEDAMEIYDAREERFGSEAMREMERWVLLRTIDSKWRDHLYEMDYLREGIGLRALAQRDPSGGIQERGLQHVPGDDGVHPIGLRPLHLSPGDRARRTGPGGGADKAARLLRGWRQRSDPELRRGRSGGGPGRWDGGQLRRGVRSGAERHAHRRRAEERGREGRAERPLSLRKRQEIQEMLRFFIVSYTSPGT